MTQKKVVEYNPMKKLSKVYRNGCAFAIAYDTGRKNEFELCSTIYVNSGLAELEMKDMQLLNPRVVPIAPLYADISRPRKVSKKRAKN
jgi:hypothetical protein